MFRDSDELRCRYTNRTCLQNQVLVSVDKYTRRNWRLSLFEGTYFIFFDVPSTSASSKVKLLFDQHRFEALSVEECWLPVFSVFAFYEKKHSLLQTRSNFLGTSVGAHNVNEVSIVFFKHGEDHSTKPYSGIMRVRLLWRRPFIGTTPLSLSMVLQWCHARYIVPPCPSSCPSYPQRFAISPADASNM